LGWTFEELTEQPFTKFIHPDDIDVSMAIFKRFQKTGKLGYTGTYTNRYLANDGTYKRVEWQEIIETDGNEYMMRAHAIESGVALDQ